MIVLVAVGCGKAPEVPTSPDTGAKDAVRGFYTAIIGKDWSGAYAFVHPEARRSLSQEQFARKAEAYRRYLAFEPKTVRIPIIEERGEEATAHIELAGTGKARHDFKDAITLRSVDGRWVVILPVNFGNVP